MTRKEIVQAIGTIVGGLLLAVVLLAEWVAIGIFIYCWII